MAFVIGTAAAGEPVLGGSDSLPASGRSGSCALPCSPELLRDAQGASAAPPETGQRNRGSGQGRAVAGLGAGKDAAAAAGGPGGCDPRVDWQVRELLLLFHCLSFFQRHIAAFSRGSTSEGPRPYNCPRSQSLSKRCILLRSHYRCFKRQGVSPV